MIAPQQHMVQEPSWPEQVILWAVHQFGPLTILLCLALGAFVLVCVIFRERVQDLLGPFLKWADLRVNGKRNSKKEG